MSTRPRPTRLARLLAASALVGPVLVGPMLIGLALVGLALAASAAARTDGDASLTMVEGEEAIRDFGLVDQGDVLEHVFHLEAGGDAPVVVTKIKPSCGCLLASVRRLDERSGNYVPYFVGTPLRPGARIEIRATVQTDGRTGILKTRVNIHTNASTEELSLGLNADVVGILRVDPTPFLALGNLPSTEDVAASFVVSSPRLGTFDLLLEERGLSKAVRVEILPLGELVEGRTDRWRVDVRVPAPHTEGPHSWMVRVRTNARLPGVSLKNFERYFTIQAHITGKVSVQPEFLSFGMFDHGSAEPLEATITVHDGRRLKQTVEPLIIPHQKTPGLDYDRALEAKVTVAEDGLSAKVVLSVKELPADFVGAINGIVQVPIGHPEREVVQLRFAGLVRAAR